MEDLNSPSEEILKVAITEIKEPIIFKRILQDEKGGYSWKLLEWSLSELAEKFGDIKLPFRVGYNTKSMGLQWEVNCPTMSSTFSEFIQKQLSEDNKEWYYCDYKYMQEWLKDKPEIINSLSWKRFGFDKTGWDSTLWIGSKGAHTNCHQDSYGCNLVAQIHGRKQWLLFPPSASNTLRPTRIPYEESTVYSKFNFFCPTQEDMVDMLKIQEKPRVVTLEPGDVLFIPAGWWHYVESLDLTVSVNTWLPITTDNISRVKEAIVKLIVGRIGKNVKCTIPDEGRYTLSYYMKLLNVTLEECKNTEHGESSSKKIKPSAWTAEDFATQYPNYVKLLCELETSKFEEFLKLKGERFSFDSTESLKDNSLETDINNANAILVNEELSEKIINALCHPDIVNTVADALLSC